MGTPRYRSIDELLVDEIPGETDDHRATRLSEEHSKTGLIIDEKEVTSVPGAPISNSDRLSALESGYKSPEQEAAEKAEADEARERRDVGGMAKAVRAFLGKHGDTPEVRQLILEIQQPMVSHVEEVLREGHGIDITLLDPVAISEAGMSDSESMESYLEEDIKQHVL